MKYEPFPALRAGDVVAVIAPSGVPEPPALVRGVELLKERYEVRTFRELTADAWGMHAGEDEVRAAELSWALEEPDIACVIAARGGYGTARALPTAALDGLRRHPRAVVGFSDITVLLAATLRCVGLQAVHGPMVCQLGRRGNPAFAPLVDVLERRGSPPPIDSLDSLSEGRASGPLLGGNLTVLTHLVGTQWFPELRGAVLFVEDVGERPYRLDRCLVHLRQTGALDGVAGIVVGDLTGCAPQNGEASAREVLERTCHALNVPGVIGVPAGHGPVNIPLVLGAQVRIDGDEGKLEYV